MVTRSNLGQLALLVVGVAGASALLTWMLTRPEPAAPPPMEALALTFEHDVIDTALAPDGTALVYTAVAEGQTWLFVRQIDLRAVTRAVPVPDEPRHCSARRRRGRRAGSRPGTVHPRARRSRVGDP